MKILSHLFFPLILMLFVACSAQQGKSPYENLVEYEGKYEYLNGATLSLRASDYDTTLYAVLDEAKYPLTYVSRDSFTNSTKDPVVFQRDEAGKISSYRVDGKTFKLLSKDMETIEWVPRKDIGNNAEGYTYKVPDKLDDGLEVGDLNKAFANPDSILVMVKETIRGNYQDVHSILIMKDNKLVLEEYFYGYDRDKLHQMRSASKSFIGTLVGIAVDQGKIKSENEKLLPLFAKEYSSFANMNPRKLRITIKDFLTYRHGMDCENDNPESKGYEHTMMLSADWAKFTLDLPMVGEPGVKSSYCTGCAQTLGRLVEVAIKTPLAEYADKNLFAPMGITRYRWRFKPDTSSITTFNQMYLRPRDMLKLAKMYQDGGRWQGKKILSADWVKRTFAKEDEEFGYLWRHKYYDIHGKRYNSYLATGNGGQKISIWPELKMITVFTGGNYNSYAVYGRQTPPNEMIPKYILAAVD